MGRLRSSMPADQRAGCSQYRHDPRNLEAHRPAWGLAEHTPRARCAPHASGPVAQWPALPAPALAILACRAAQAHASPQAADTSAARTDVHTPGSTPGRSGGGGSIVHAAPSDWPEHGRCRALLDGRPMPLLTTDLSVRRQAAAGLSPARCSLLAPWCTRPIVAGGVMRLRFPRSALVRPKLGARAKLGAAESRSGQQGCTQSGFGLTGYDRLGRA